MRLSAFWGSLCGMDLRSLRALNAFSRASSPLERIAAGASLAEDIRDMVVRAHAWHKSRTTWSVRIDASDSTFMQVEDWLMARIPQVHLHSVIAQTVRYVDLKDGTSMTYEQYRNSAEAMIENPMVTPYSRFSTSVGTKQSHKEFIGGHEVEICAYPQGVGPTESSASEDPVSRRMADNSMTSAKTKGKIEASIVFYVRSLEGREAVLNFLDSFANDTGEKKKPSTLYFANSWGEWQGNPAPRRSLDSVILRDGVAEELRNDIEKFLKDESKYTRLGIPFHRGYLLHGPPGTGKTSLVKALASELGLDLWFMSMGDIKEDSGMLSMIRSVREGGILLLEDVDSFAPVLSREDGEGVKKSPDDGVSTSALLNALDGVATPHGLITIMTTNYVDRLDEAILRSGRVDMSVELGHPSWGEVQRLWQMFYSEAGVEVVDLGDEPEWFASSRVSQADVSEVFKRHWETPELARIELTTGAFVR